jgi:hypothetical protein
MANKTITDYSAATGIDAAADYLLIEQSSVYNKINRNTLLGVSGTPADISTTQTFTNKTIGNSNTIAVKAANLQIQDGTDTTKVAKFVASSISTGTTRSYTLPDITDTLVTLTATQTLTNKTLTSPTINSPTITNATITADTVSGYTTSNSGTIYGMSVSSGVIASAALAGAVNTAALATGAVTGAKLATSAIQLGYASITSNFTGTATSFSVVTGLSVTVTVPSGGRSVKISVVAQYIGSSHTAGASMTLDIYDVTAGAEIGQLVTTVPAANYACNPCFFAFHTPASGSRTYEVRYTQSGSATFTMAASTTAPAFILVELI